MADPCDIVEDAVAAADSLPSSVVLAGSPVEDAGVLAEVVTPYLFALFADTGVLAETVTDAKVHVLTDTGQIVDAVIQTADCASLVKDRAAAQSFVFSTYGDLVVASGALTDAVIQSDIAELVRDGAALADSVTQIRVAVELVKAAMIGRDALIQVVYEGIIEDGMDGAAVAVGYADVMNLATDAGALADAVMTGAVLRNMIVETAALAVVLTDQLDALELVRDDAWAWDAVLGDANGMTWWTAPTDTLAMSRYRMPELQSIAPVNGELVAVGLAGSFVRGGDSDDGTAIDAYVRTGLHDFGSEFLKRVNHLYSGYTSGGSMQVDVGETSTGVEVVYSYTMPPRAATAPTHGRILLGRGLRSLYYRFTLRNSAGKSLAVSTANVDVDETGRKV